MENISYKVAFHKGHRQKDTKTAKAEERNGKIERKNY